MQENQSQDKTVVSIDIIDPQAGLYGALSSDQERWYVVNVATRMCSCPSGAHRFRGVKAHGGQCRHLVAARTVARGLASMTAADRARVLRSVRNIRVNVAAVDWSRLGAPLVRHQAAA